MVILKMIKPLDQPLGRRRLLDDLKICLQDPNYNDCKIIVAYAKSGPLLRIMSLVEAWRTGSTKKSISAIIGVDQRGTSREALHLALRLFDEVYITKEPGITFHPKIYLFQGPNQARVFIGSNNLTVGGTELNFEAAIDIQLDLSTEKSFLNSIESAWTDLLPGACPSTQKLTPALFYKLIHDRTIIRERMMRIMNASGDSSGLANGSTSAPTGLLKKPGSPLPIGLLNPATRGTAGATRKPRSPKVTPPSKSPVITPSSIPVNGLAIQIKPHGNGEIFLSVSAALQIPAFFRWPFSGLSTPKKKGNVPYPQLTPDPLVNIAVFDTAPTPILTRVAYPLNTVYYESKSEIRITASPLVGCVPAYSIMLMELSKNPGISYDITIYTPSSPNYAKWMSACNQQMPGGGKTPRKFGWF
jgi:HKD family nuclease